MTNNIKLNKNLILVQKEVFDEQMVDGIIIPGKMTGMVSYGNVVLHGGIEYSELSDEHNDSFVDQFTMGKRICYYNNNQSQLIFEDNKYYLISVKDVIYIII